MKRPIVLALLAVATPAFSQDPAPLARGKQVFDHWCASCHAGGIGNPGFKGKPGTEAITAKYNGEQPGVLTDRTDLTPESVSVFVRNGVSIMPFFRQSEITDAELRDLGEYLSKNNKDR